MNVLFYQTPGGASPVEKYFAGLPLDERATIVDALRQVARAGLAGVNVRPTVGKLWEIRFPMQRVFYVVIGGPTMVLLHAYKKQGQKAPRREIEVALKRMHAVLSFGG